jgi:Flp pilus assembly protein TadG
MARFLRSLKSRLAKSPLAASRSASRRPLGRRGNIAVMVALMSLPTVAAVGLSVDGVRAYMLQNRMVTAIDVAALAGGRVLSTANVEADVRMYFHANIPSDYMGATVGTPTITVGSNDETLVVRASASLPTTFMRVFGVDTVPVSVSNQIRRTIRGMELALVLDVTGSMWSGDKIGQLRTSARDLVNILFGPNEETQTLWISLVPYTATVNLGAGRQSWLSATSPAASAYLPDIWRGCVEARVNNDASELPPSAAPFTSFLYHSTLGQYPGGGDNDWPPVTDSTNYIDTNDRAGPNLGCGPPVLPLSNKKTDILNRISALKGVNRGGTMANIGLQAGWFTLSPLWRGLWGGPTPAGLPLNYGTPDSDKAVVLLTDGTNEWYDYSKPPAGDYTAYGRLSEGRLGTTSAGTATARINTRMVDLCTAMKAKKITIYTITLMVTNNTTKDLYRSCASQPSYYFNSPTATELSGIFRQIGSQLSNLRIER